MQINKLSLERADKQTFFGQISDAIIEHDDEASFKHLKKSEEEEVKVFCLLVWRSKQGWNLLHPELTSQIRMINAAP